MKEEELKKKFPYVWKTLIERHDDDMEYCEELITDGDEETAKLNLPSINEIRRFFEDKELTFEEIKKDLEEVEEINKREKKMVITDYRIA